MRISKFAHNKPAFSQEYHFDAVESLYLFIAALSECGLVDLESFIMVRGLFIEISSRRWGSGLKVIIFSSMDFL